MWDKLKRLLKWAMWGVLSAGLLGGLVLVVLIFRIEKELPDVSILKDIHLQVPLRIYSQEGDLIAEYGEWRRIPIPYEQIPKPLIDAVLATEDQRFFEHSGVDLLGLGRATVALITTGAKVQGGSTITMQVARNFFLTRKKTYSRKLREILLAIKIENELTKEQILDLYLNKIFYGNRAYGVAAAAQVYYGKPLDQLTLAQYAMIAGLPKAPSTLNPLANPDAALNRRNHVLERMMEHDYITQQQYQAAIAEPLVASFHGLPITCPAPYVAELVRDGIVAQFGEDAYSSGMNIYTTINCNQQKAAQKALVTALVNYDQRHGFRGPLNHFAPLKNNDTAPWIAQLSQIPTIANLYPAAVLSLSDQTATVLLSDGSQVTIPWDGLKWARLENPDGGYGRMPKTAKDIFNVGDVIRVRNNNGAWELAQIPEVEGALVSLDPKDGAVKALVGGFDYDKSNYNRVTQAKRQPGSSFKPFIYAAALSKGFTLASTINDAPVLLNNPAEDDYWRPENDTKEFYGPTRLRVALSKSRNLVSIRLLQSVGVSYTLDYLTKFGFDTDTLPRSLTLALGTVSITPLELASAYAIFANGGYKVSPYMIDKIVSMKGNLIYKAKPKIACEDCFNQLATSPQNPSIPNANGTPNTNTTNNDPNTNTATPNSANAAPAPVPNAAAQNYAPAVISPQIAFLMTSAMKDVITEGTGRRALVLNREDIAGKTGTTNDMKDGWFAGFNSDVVTVVWVGFDQPKSLHEYGSRAALPLWIDFMEQALAGLPSHTMTQPPGISSVLINPATGNTAYPGEKNGIFEFFDTENMPAVAKNTPTDTPANKRTSVSFDDMDSQLF